MRIYISGPMRGQFMYNFPAFDETSNAYRDSGHEVISPADLDRNRGFDPTEWSSEKLNAYDWGSIPDDFDLKAVAMEDIDLIKDCDAILMLDGWENSKGCLAEKAFAEWLQIPVLYDPVTKGEMKLLQRSRQKFEWLDVYLNKLDARLFFVKNKKPIHPWPGAPNTKRELIEGLKAGKSIAWALGPNDFVIDIPPSSKPWPVRTEKVRAVLGSQFQNCLMVSTPSGGIHFYATKPKDFPYSRSDLRKLGIDVYVEGSFVVVGPGYRFIESPHVEDAVQYAAMGLDSLKEIEEDILEEALRITSGNRQASYGPPDQDFRRTAGIWSALFGDMLRPGVFFEPFHVALAMIGLKASRQMHQRKRDNWVDLAGYSRCGQICDEVAKTQQHGNHAFRIGPNGRVEFPPSDIELDK